MNEGDRKNFSQAIGQLMAIYADSVTPTVLNAWWGALKPYSFKDVVNGMNRHATDSVAGMFRPTPAHVIAHISAIERERAATIASILRDAQPEIDRIENAMYTALHDARHGRLTEDAAQATVKDCKNRLSLLKSGLTQRIEKTRLEIGHVD